MARQRQTGDEGNSRTSDGMISVIIPCYNQGYFLSEAIESVLSQTWLDIEIIVVDDGSNDNTSDVASRYPYVRCIGQANQGVCAARNAGLRESKGQCVVFLDADDRLLPNALEIGLEYLMVHPECAFVSGRAKLIGGDETPLGTERRSCIGSDHYFELLRDSNHIWNPSVSVYRRDILERVGAYNTSIVVCEDYELNLRIARSFPVYCHENVVAEYRIHQQNATHNAELMLKSILAVYRLQTPYVKGHKGYEQAHATGRRRERDSYGDQCASQVSACVKAGELGRGLRGVLVLLRYYPTGFVRHTCPGVYHALSRVIGAGLNATSKLERTLRRQNTGWIRARPNPVEVIEASGLGVTTLSWMSEGTETVEVHVGTPDGVLFSRTGPSGSATTGKWVRGGMVFYLQDVSGGKPLTSTNTLSTVSVNNTANIALHLLEVLARQTLVLLKRIARRWLLRGASC